jgi:3'-5' exoribonuclease
MNTTPAPSHPIRELKAAGSPTHLKFTCWIADNQTRETTTQKNYTQLVIADAEIRETLKIWDNFLCAGLAKNLKSGQVVELEGTFSYGQYGLETDKQLAIHELPESESAAWIADNLKNPDAEEAFKKAEALIEFVTCPILKETGRIFLREYKDQILRSGGARFYHHARRGGLVEHFAKMMETGGTLARQYKANVDLVMVGALMHDSGKIHENQYEAEGLTMPFNPEGELLSHIPLGMMITEKCLEKAKEVLGTVSLERFQATRIHLLHLVASHHGTNEWGSPITPKTPEALILHTIDNLDAKMEFYRDAATNGKVVGETQGVRLFEKRFPFPGCTANSLAPHEQQA